MGYVLVIHTQDAEDVVAPIIRGLRESDLDCFTYKQRLRLARLGSILVHELEIMVQTASAVIAFASEGLNQDYRALTLLTYANAHGNLILLNLPKNRITFPYSLVTDSYCLEIDLDPSKRLSQVKNALFAQTQPRY